MVPILDVVRSAVVAALLSLAVLPGSARADLLKGPYLQNLTSDGVTVMWQVDRPAPARVTVEGPGATRVIDVRPARLPETVVSGLRAATRYRYAVEVAGKVHRGEFATAPPVGASVPFSFVVFGDTRGNVESHRRVMDRAAAEVPDFVVGTGDLVDHGDRLDMWQTFFDVERAVLRDNVIFPALGNHDRQGRGRTADNYRSFFSLPENGPDPERYYAFSYGNARFLVLDSNSSSFALTDQTAWIEEQLVAARQDRRVGHVFIVMHHPPFSISLHGGQRDLRERWTPLFERYGVTAVFSGHDHCYERAERNGVHYFVSGGGGAPLYGRGQRAAAIDKATVRTYERVLHYLRVSVNGAQIDVSAIRAGDGSTIETTAWGEPPRSPAIAAASGAAEPPSTTPAAAQARVAPRDTETGGIGWFGMAGAAAALLAAVVLVRVLRR